MVSYYAEYVATQKELINDERFFFYLEKIISAGISPSSINHFLNEIHLRKEHGIDYLIGRLISSMTFTYGKVEIFYDYLKYFSDLPSDKTQKANIIKCISMYQEELAKPVSELTDIEKSLFMESFLTKKSLIPNPFNRAFSLLLKPGMADILRFINENSYRVSLKINNYEELKNFAGRALEHFMFLSEQLNHNHRYVEMLITHWIDNNCPEHDLDVLRSKLGSLDDDRLNEVLNSRSGYVNLIYGNKICNMSLAIIPRHKEELLIYAITQGKNDFIRLIEENQDMFSYFDKNSILFDRKFYSQFVNLDSLTAENLDECREMNVRKIIFGSFEQNRVYSFGEIRALYGLPEQYYKLYASLNITDLNIRLTALKQLSENNLLTLVEDDDCIKRLAEKLSHKSLNKWRDGEFSHIANITLQDNVELLIYFKEIEKFIPQLKNRTDVKLLVRNRTYTADYETLNEMKMNLRAIDSVWRELVGKLSFSDEFLSRNQEGVYAFLCRNNAEIANIYYDNLYSDEHREALRRIVQAELMGELNKLKYYAGGLSKKIDLPLDSSIDAIWQKNTENSIDKITVKECDDFYSTMILGAEPQRTVLSYENGDNLECLLSGFDSDKKVLFAFIGEKIVSRAIIRLTKGKFKHNKKSARAENNSSFVDLEAESFYAANQEESEKDRPVLFLEHAYAADISETELEQINEMYIDLMEKKAASMNAMLILSNSYESMTRTDFTKTLFHVYISKSKAGSQYLDSLSDYAHVFKEEGYMMTNIFIREDDILMSD